MKLKVHSVALVAAVVLMTGTISAKTVAWYFTQGEKGNERGDNKACDVVKTVICRILKSDVPPDVLSRFIVNPMNSYYVRGNPIMTGFKIRRKEA